MRRLHGDCLLNPRSEVALDDAVSADWLVQEMPT